MKKLNPIVYHKILLQAEEAKERDMTKLASAVFNTLGSLPEDEPVIYNNDQLQNDIYDSLWKSAVCVLSIMI